MIADKDLLSMQYARILAENASQAQRKLASLSQEKLDAIVEHVAAQTAEHTRSLALLSHEETEYGRWQDKVFKNDFACTRVPEALRTIRCVGVIREDPANGLMDIGVPMGVIVALCPSTSPVSTTIYTALLAIKSGNAVIFSPHPRAEKSISRVLDIMMRAAYAEGLPEGALSYLGTVTKAGTLELMRHSATSLILNTGVPGMLEAAHAAGKPVLYGGHGHGPAFIERSADLKQAVQDVITSKCFDNGIAPSAEQSVVVEASVADEVKRLFIENGAYFMNEAEAQTLAALLRNPDGSCKKHMMGKSAAELAKKAGFAVNGPVSLLMAERKYVSESDPYSGGFLAPVLAFYVEDNWEFACEKCIELLLYERNSHTLVIHSKNEDVIRQFAIKKPVARLLVNTPAAFGGVGATTNLFPALTLGSGSAGQGITSDNVSPMNLIYVRKVGYGVRQAQTAATSGVLKAFGPTSPATEVRQPDREALQILYRLLTKAIGP